MSRKIEVITDALCIIGEGPLWDADKGLLYTVDIQGKRLRTINFKSGEVTDRVLPQQIGFSAITDKGELLVGAEDGVYKINDGFTRYSKPHTLKGMRFNDGKVGPDGKFYLGTYSRDNSAAFYRMDGDGTLTELFDKVGNSNGLDWDADGVMYYNDTPTGRTDAIEFCGGEIVGRREVFRYENGAPDGMCIDANGNLWTAVWGTSKVLCINPEKGCVVDEITLPVSQPTCCAFAGDNLKTLVITSAAHGRMLRDEPLAGATFAVELDVCGLLPNKLITVT